MVSESIFCCCCRYKLGFCPNGPDCRYRHAKLPGPAPSVEEVFQKIQHLSSFNYNSSNRFFQHRNNGFNQSQERPQFSQPAGLINPDTTVKTSPAIESSQSTNILQPQSLEQPQLQPSQQQVSQNQAQNPPTGLPNQTICNAIPLPPGQSRLVTFLKLQDFFFIQSQYLAL